MPAESKYFEAYQYIIYSLTKRDTILKEFYKKFPPYLSIFFVQNSVYTIIGTGKGGAGVVKVDHLNLNLRNAVDTHNC